jgi:hypothetical protein
MEKLTNEFKLKRKDFVMGKDTETISEKTNKSRKSDMVMCAYFEKIIRNGKLNW